jgi:hypothetical protein
MREDELPPDKLAELQELVAEFQRQLERVRVDMRAAAERMHEIAPPTRRELGSEDSDAVAYEESFTIDVTGILDTLRGLPDGAGTSAFVEAYNATHRDWRDAR